MEVYLKESEDCCDNCKTKLFNHLFEKEYDPRLIRLLDQISYENAKSIFRRLGAPERALRALTDVAMRKFPSTIHADFIDYARLVMAIDLTHKLAHAIDLFEAIREDLKKSANN